MRIEKYTKLKNGQYKLSFDDGTNTLLHEDLILKHSLLIYKEVSSEKLDELLSENKAYIAYDLALSYLKVKMRSKKEVKEYLSKKSISEEVINNAIDILVKKKYLDDEVYCKAFIMDRINLSSDGPYKIRESLKKLGINEELIEKTIQIFDIDLEGERINKIISKQVKSNHNKSEYALKRKIIEYLTNLGYTKKIVVREVESLKISDSEIREKEYKKMYDKLSKKYSGKDLDYRIKQKMYQKGFYSE